MSGLELLIQLVKSAIRLFIGTATLVHRYRSTALLGALCMFAEPNARAPSAIPMGSTVRIML